MKRLIMPTLLLAAACALGLGYLTTANGEPAPKPRGDTTFTFAFEAPPQGELQGTIEGNFSVEGALKDSGLATESYELVPLDAEFKEFSASGSKLLQGREGTMEMCFEAQLHDYGTWGEAQWWIVDGTGAYKKIRGMGEGAVWVEFPEGAPPYLAAAYSGEILKDPSLE